jgi:hypothetical protein
MVDANAPTHTHDAFSLKKENKKYGRWLEIGKARVEGKDKPAHIFLDRVPVGGWNGYVYLSPIGVKPPEPEPQRPSEPSEEEF